MKRYLIEEAKCGVSAGGMACGPISGSIVVTIRFNDGSKTQWFSMTEFEGFPSYYLADEDHHDELVEEDFDDEQFTAFLDEHRIDDFDGLELGGEYPDLFSAIADNPENPAIPLIRFAVALVRCSMDEEEELIRMATGKYADELDIPASDLEEDYVDEMEDNEEDDEDEDFDDDESIPEGIDKVSLYRLRLALEAEIRTPNIYQDLDDGAFRSLKRKLRNAVAQCDDEKDYEVWKSQYIAAEYEKLKGKKFITFPYIFAGIGQYEATMPAEQKASFICWINGNGSAFAGTERDATEEEVKNYIALHANDGKL